MTNWNGTAISYDLNGNMQSDGANTFTWNARNQVATLNSVGLQYDAFGRRIKNAAGTSFLYDGPNATQEVSGSTPTANIWTGGVDELFQRSDGNGTVTPLADALGSVIALVNSSGSIVTTYSYDPYGNTTITGAASSNLSQYTGRENEGNGLYFYRARYYAPPFGRFINEDPLSFAGSGPDVYAYVGDSPGNSIDPLGLSRDCFFSSCGGLPGGTSERMAGRKDNDTWWRDFFAELIQGGFSTGTHHQELCLVTFFEATGQAMNPLNFQGDSNDWISLGYEGTPKVLSGYAFFYASRAINVYDVPGLIKPFSSPAVRNLVGASEALEEASPVFAFDLAALTQGLPSEYNAFRTGGCEASF